MIAQVFAVVGGKDDQRVVQIAASAQGIQQAANLDLTSMLSVEWESQQQCWVSRETTEGLRARLEGREPELEASTGEEGD